MLRFDAESNLESNLKIIEFFSNLRFDAESYDSTITGYLAEKTDLVPFFVAYGKNKTLGFVPTLQLYNLFYIWIFLCVTTRTLFVNGF